MNSYELSRSWFDWCFENPSKVKPIHSAIYFFAIEHCNRLGWKKEFGFPSQMTMDAIGVRKHQTYGKGLNDLVEWGFIKMIEKSKNQYSANIISIDATPENGKALDKALVKHGAKQGKSTGQSTDSINKQLNKQTKNNKQADSDVRVRQFDRFWELYDNKKGKQKSLDIWLSLSEDEIDMIRKTIGRYLADTPDKKFRKHPSTYLNQKTWLDYVRSDGKVDEAIPIVEPGWVYVGLSEAYDIIRDQNSVSLSEKEAIGAGDDYVRKMMNINPSYHNVGKGWKYRENK